MRPAWSCEPLTKGRWGTARSPTSNVSQWTSPDPDGWMHPQLCTCLLSLHYAKIEPLS